MKGKQRERKEKSGREREGNNRKKNSPKYRKPWLLCKLQNGRSKSFPVYEAILRFQGWMCSFERA
jgi:hypothetical protein